MNNPLAVIVVVESSEAVFWNVHAEAISFAGTGTFGAYPTVPFAGTENVSTIVPPVELLSETLTAALDWFENLTKIRS